MVKASYEGVNRRLCRTAAIAEIAIDSEKTETNDYAEPRLRPFSRLKAPIGAHTRVPSRQKRGSVESIGIAYVRTIAGNSTSETFSEVLKLSITYHYHPVASGTF
jgi:hypothetical protein